MNKTSAFIYKCRGFISLPLSWWVILSLGAIVLILGTLLKVQSSRLESAQERIKAYELAGQLAKQEADRKDKLNKERKDKADASHKRAIAKLNSDIQRMRDTTYTGGLSGSPSSTVCPKGLVCFSEPEYRGAVREFIENSRRLADEGSEIAIDLRSAQDWARE